MKYDTCSNYASYEVFLKRCEEDLQQRRGGRSMLKRLAETGPIRLALGAGMVRVVESDGNVLAGAVIDQDGVVWFAHSLVSFAWEPLISGLLAEFEGAELEIPVLAGDRAAKSSCEEHGLKGALVVMTTASGSTPGLKSNG